MSGFKNSIRLKNTYVHDKLKDYSKFSGKKIYRIVEDALEEYLDKKSWETKVIKK